MIMIEDVDAWEVLDSRGRPTVRVRVETTDGAGTFTVPTGASTGEYEAVEIRDGQDRYGGKGVQTAIENIRSELSPLIIGRDCTAQRELDSLLVERDGTKNLSRIGGNAVLGVSGAIAHAASASLNRPLYKHIDGNSEFSLPLPMVNILSGGLHAEGGLALQDFLLVPTGAGSYSEAIENIWSVREAVRNRLSEMGYRTLLADEGGFSPPFNDVDEAFTLLTRSIVDAGFEPVRDDMAIALDIAASHFYDPKTDEYSLASIPDPLGSEEMIQLLTDWVDRYPIISIEDPLAENDWTGWQDLNNALAGDIQIVGDDLIATNLPRLHEAITTEAANSVLIKPNQAGTMTRTLDVISEAKNEGFMTVISARSGETCDSTIADIAVGVNSGQIKIGSLARSERLAKYNRLFALQKQGIDNFSADIFS